MSNSRFRKFKKIVLVYVLTLACIASVSAESTMSAVFQYDSRSLHIDGNFGDAYGAPVIVSVTSDGESESLPVSIRQYYAGNDGAILIDMPISKELGNGKYWVKVVTENGSFTDSFMYLNNTSTETDSIIELINAAESASALHFVVLNEADKIGIDLSKYDESYIEYASKLVYSAKTFYGGSYDMSEFNTAFNTGIAVAIMNYDSVDSALSAFASVFGVTYSEYQAYDADFKSVFSDFLKNADYSSKDAKTIYTDCLLLAEVKLADTWHELSEIVLINTEYLGIDSSHDYYDISEKNRYCVFAEMLKDKFDTIEDLIDSFESCAEEVLDDLSSKKSSSKGSGGGGSGSGSPSVVVYPDTSTTVNNQDKETASTNLTDIIGHWAESSINAMAEKGVITGFDDKTFKPDNAVTRAEFAVLIMRAFGFEQSSEIVFSDVDSGDWFAEAVATLSHHGIINGYNNKFNPNDSISRQDAATIVARVLKEKGVEFTGFYEFEDSSLISTYAAEAVERLAHVGLLKGDGYNFRPHDMISRAETAVIIDRIFDIFEDVIK